MKSACVTAKDSGEGGSCGKHEPTGKGSDTSQEEDRRDVTSVSVTVTCQFQREKEMTTQHSNREQLVRIVECLPKGDRVQMRPTGVEELGDNTGRTGTAQARIGLHDAVLHQDVDAVRRLLAEGADPDEPDWDGSGDAPLLRAAATGNVDIVRLLAARGCALNVRTARGETALHLAVSGRRPACALVAALLPLGCDANIQENLQGCTALHALARNMAAYPEALLDTFRTLALRTDTNVRDHRRRTALHRLAAAGCTSLQPFQVLLDCGADPSLQSDRGETSLLEALERDAPGCGPAVLLLVAAGTDLARSSAYGETALHVAARKNRPASVAAMLAAGAPPNAADLRGNTALHLAAGRGFPEVARLLLACPAAELNAANRDGLTPLHIAVESGFIQVVQMLLEADTCDLTAKTSLRQTPLDLAQHEYRQRCQPELAGVLTRAIEQRQADNRT